MASSGSQLNDHQRSYMSPGTMGMHAVAIRHRGQRSHQQLHYSDVAGKHTKRITDSFRPSVPVPTARIGLSLILVHHVSFVMQIMLSLAVLFIAVCGVPWTYGQLCAQDTLFLEDALTYNCTNVNTLVIAHHSSLQDIVLPVMISLNVQGSSLRDFSGVVFRQSIISGSVTISDNLQLTSCWGK